MANDPHLETDAAIWAEGTEWTKDDLLRGYRDWQEYAGGDDSFEWWCENVMKIRNEPEVSDG